MARPTFKIDPKRLLCMRKELHLTQQEVAIRAHQFLSTTKDYPTTNATLVTTYQRIEKTGNTSKKRAVALAKVLMTTVEILQGDDVPEDSEDFVSRVLQHICEQKASGNNPALERALGQHIQAYGNHNDIDECMRDFAECIGEQIEVAQIGQNSNEIERLAELTGWPETQLRQPGGVHGHWLLLNTVQGSRETEIVLGVSAVIRQIQETVEESGNWHESDVRITFRRSLPWYHLEIVHPRISALRCNFSFVRCQPEVSGLKWVNPHWRDQLWLEKPLEEWAFSTANLFTDFDGKNRPNDIRQLRFRVRERGAKGAHQRVAYSRVHLDELPEEVFQNFKKNGICHELVIKRLAAGLAQSLAPLLTTYPRDCWTIRAGACHIAILLDLPYRLWHANNDPINCDGIRYRIDLVEESSPGTYQPAPWRDSSVAEVTRLLEERAFEKHDDMDGEEALLFLSLPDNPN